jgi:hypothetical protein
MDSGHDPADLPGGCLMDLILDWREVTQQDPRAARSVSRQDSFNKELLQHAHA